MKTKNKKLGFNFSFFFCKLHGRKYSGFETKHSPQRVGYFWLTNPHSTQSHGKSSCGVARRGALRELSSFARAFVTFRLVCTGTTRGVFTRESSGYYGLIKITGLPRRVITIPSLEKIDVFFLISVYAKLFRQIECTFFQVNSAWIRPVLSFSSGESNQAQKRLRPRGRIKHCAGIL